MIAGRFLEVLDEDQDKALSEKELVGRFKTWFGEWDKAKTGSIDEETLKNGLTDAFMPKPE